MKYKAIIFDMDGTIIDSEHIWKQVTQDLIESKNVSLSQEEHNTLNQKLKGLALHASCAIIKTETGITDDLKELVQEKKERALALYKTEVAFIKGFQNFHKKTQDNKLKTGIATNADDHTLDAAVKLLKLDNYFGEHIYGISHVNHVHKPSPDLYLHVANKLMIDPSECVAIEDTSHGVKAAIDAGMFCIGINTAKDRDKLKQANLIIDSYDEISLEKLLKKNELI